MGSTKVRLLALSLLTLALLLAATLLMQRTRATRPDAGASAPVDAVPAPDEPGYALAQAGMRALEAGDPRSALRLFDRAIEAAPDRSVWQAWRERARLEVEARERQAGRGPTGGGRGRGAQPPEAPAPSDGPEAPPAAPDPGAAAEANDADG